eukprot:6200078-Pleurochrysis_carterae.AAC.5
MRETTTRRVVDAAREQTPDRRGAARPNNSNVSFVATHCKAGLATLVRATLDEHVRTACKSVVKGRGQPKAEEITDQLIDA